ncbi:MAG: DUF1015 family protein [Verrucomicrobia bacterium]|nr:DUF1015 family protein [Verrucomicrobiota bacterium]
MQHVMLEEMAVLNLTSSPWQNLSPIRINEDLSSGDISSFYLIEIAFSEKPIYGIVGSICARNILDGQIYCHEKVFPEKLERIKRELVNDLIQKNPIVLIAELDDIWNFSPSLISEWECLRIAQTKNGQPLRLFKLPEEWNVSLAKIPLCLADGHHRYHAIRNLIMSEKGWQEASIAAAIFPVSSSPTSRKKVDFSQGEFPCSSFFSFLDRYSILKEIDRNRFSDGIKIRFQKKWYEIPINLSIKNLLGIRASKDCMIFSHLFFLELLKKSKINAPFRLIPELDSYELENEMEKTDNDGIILPPDDPNSVIKFAFGGKILEANSTFFKAKFPDNLITHRIII